MSQDSEDKQGAELGVEIPSLLAAATNPTIQVDHTDENRFSSDAEYYHFDSAKSPSPAPVPAPVPARYTKKTQGGDVPRRTRGRTRRRATQKREAHDRIDADSIDSDSGSSIDEYYEIASLASSIDENLTWRGRMQSVLHNHWLHIGIVCLVALDAFIVIFELLLDVGAFGNNICNGEGFLQQSEQCHYANKERCGPHASMISNSVNISVAPGNGLGNEGLCVCKYRRGQRVCVEQGESFGVNPALVLHVCSLAILSLFMVEIALKVIAFRLKYFTHKFEVFDGAVVVLSWILDVASLAREEAFEAAALLIVLRLWRVVRIVNGAVLSAKVQVDNQLDEARAEARRIIHAFHKCQDKLEDSEKENTQLKEQLRLRGRGKATASSKAENGKKVVEGEYSDL